MSLIGKQNTRKPIGRVTLNRPLSGRFFPVMLLCLLAFGLIGAGAPASEAKATKTPKPGSGGPSPYDVIAAVNQVRASNGLPAYTINGALMAAAQAHSDYQASIGSTTHSGSGGSDVKGRALAAGYGGGSDVSVVENIYGGMNASAQQAVSWWQGDSLHLNTLLSTRHTEAGAGVAVAGGVVYFTLDVGQVSGNPLPAITAVSSGTGATPASGATAVDYTSGVIVSTPNLDGSVTHKVQAGEALWTIAAVYKISVDELKQLNGLNSNFLKEGQELIIKSAGVAGMETAAAKSASETESVTVTPYPTVTRRPTRTPTPAGTAPATSTAATSTAEKAVSFKLPEPLRGIDPLLVIIGLLVIGGGLMLVVGSVLNRGGQ